jgi:cell division protein ZapA (FtsZ GTPase activity inhibitor)
MDNMRKCKVSIYGESYTLVTDETEEHLSFIARVVNDSMQNIAQKTGMTDTKKIAIMAAIQLASKLDSTHNALKSYERKSVHLIDHIDHELAHNM